MSKLKLYFVLAKITIEYGKMDTKTLSNSTHDYTNQKPCSRLLQKGAYCQNSNEHYIIQSLRRYLTLGSNDFGKLWGCFKECAWSSHFVSNHEKWDQQTGLIYN